MRRSIAASSLAGFAALLGVVPVFAADTPHTDRGPRCPLPYSPFSHEKSTPAELVCRLDADDDGLDDAIENRIAECFMPAFRFDTAETALASFPGPVGVASAEPRALFHVSPVDAAPPISAGAQTFAQAQIKYTFLWNYDAGWYDVYGFAGLNPAGFREAHNGDSQAIDVTVRFLESPPGSWTAELVGLNTGYAGTWQAGATDPVGSPPVSTETCPNDTDDNAANPWNVFIPLPPLAIYGWVRAVSPRSVRLRTLYADGTNPIVFSSAGKHHFSLRSFEMDTYSSIAYFPIYGESSTGGTTDRSNGQGVARTPLAHSTVKRLDGTLGDAYHNVGLLVEDGTDATIVRANRCADNRSTSVDAAHYAAPGPFLAGETLRDVWFYNHDFTTRAAFCGGTRPIASRPTRSPPCGR